LFLQLLLIGGVVNSHSDLLCAIVLGINRLLFLKPKKNVV